MYKTVYQEKFGRLTVRERSYTLTLYDEDYLESDPIPVPMERISPARECDRLSEFVRDFVAGHPNTDLVNRLTKKGLTAFASGVDTKY
jgi:hypothetical protein